MKIQGKVGEVGKSSLVAGVLVSVLVGEDATTTLTDADGHYLLDEITDQTQYQVTCSKRGYYSDVALVAPKNFGHTFINHSLRLMPRVLSVEEVLDIFLFTDVTDETSVGIAIDATVEIGPVTDLTISGLVSYDITTGVVTLTFDNMGYLAIAGIDSTVFFSYLLDLFVDVVENAPVPLESPPT